MAFQFAFNNPTYSDRKLRLVIDQDPPLHQEEEKGEEEEEAEAEEEERSPKRRRLENADPGQPSSVSGAADEFNEYYVNTLLLAKDSVFFRRIFDGDCFKESAEKAIDIHLTYKEKEPFIELLRYLYIGKLEAKTVEDFINIWHVAQRFAVHSCSELCMQMLQGLPLSLESSCYFLEVAPTVDQTDDYKELIKRSISFLVTHFKVSLVMKGEDPGRWTNFKDFKGLPAIVLDSLLRSDDLQVIHEESVFHAVQTWVTQNTENSMQETEAWKRLGPLIRWPYIETFRLKAIIAENEDERLKEFLVEALVYQDSSEKGKASNADLTCPRFRRRACHALPLKFLHIDFPVKYGLTFFSVSMKDWNRLQSDGSICTERFLLDDCIFVWLLKARKSPISEGHRVSILLVALNAPTSPLRVVITLAIWMAHSKSYTIRHRGAHFLRQDVHGRVISCHDCFERDVDRLAYSEFIHEGEVWFKTEVYVERCDLPA